MVIVGAQAGRIALPWGAWRHDDVRTFEVPAAWEIVNLAMRGGSPLGEAEIAAALDRPIEAPSLGSLVSAGSRVAIAVDDITRPAPVAPVLGPVVERLAEAGIDDDRITIVIASGAHRRPTAWDIEQKIGGRLAARLRVACHDPDEGLAETGVMLAGVPVRVNRAFHEADVRVGITSVLPHPFAGFSGGGKIVIPGLANMDVLVRTHKYALMGLAGGHTLEGNRFRADMEAAVRAIGLHWTVNLVVNAERRLAFAAAGDMVAAHRAAATAAAGCGRTEAPDRLLDALLLNAYPKDGELLQIESAFVALRSGMLEWLKPGAPIVLIGACVEGLGTHGLFGPGGRLYRVPSERRFLGDHPLIIYSPGVQASEARLGFAAQYPFFTQWPAIVDALSTRLPGSPRIGIVPCGPLQLSAKHEPS